MADLHGHRGHTDPRRGNSAPVGGVTRNSLSPSTPAGSPGRNQLLFSQDSLMQPMEVASRLEIIPDGNEFFPLDAVNKISNIIKARYDKPWVEWKEIPMDHKMVWYEEFKKQCRWIESNHKDIVRIWKCKSAEIIRQSLGDIRKGREEGTWLGKDVLEALKHKWNTSPELKESSERSKKNASAEKDERRKRPRIMKEDPLSDLRNRVQQLEDENQELHRELCFGGLRKRLKLVEVQNKRLGNEVAELHILYQMVESIIGNQRFLNLMMGIEPKPPSSKPSADGEDLSDDDAFYSYSGSL